MSVHSMASAESGEIILVYGNEYGNWCSILVFLLSVKGSLLMSDKYSILHVYIILRTSNTCTKNIYLTCRVDVK